MKFGLSIGFALLASTQALANTTCTHDDFEQFLGSFAGSAEIQKANSVDPLPTTTYSSMGSSMPAPNRLSIDHTQLDWPVMPSLDALDAQGLEVKVSQARDGRTRVFADARDGREVSFIWFFEQTPCWTLVEMVDGTLRR